MLGHVSLARARVYVRDACNHATCNLIYHSQILQCNMKQSPIKVYGKYAHFSTPAQVRMLFEALGEP